MLSVLSASLFVASQSIGASGRRNASWLWAWMDFCLGDWLQLCRRGKKEENGEQKILLKGVESEENDMLQLWLFDSLQVHHDGWWCQRTKNCGIFKRHD